MSWAGEFADSPNVRVWVQFIALPHSTLTELLAEEPKSDVDLHRKVMAMTRSGKAGILETGMVSGAEGEKATVESIREDIYPAEYDPPELIWERQKFTPKKSRDSNLPRAINCTAFETRNAGFTIEYEATIASKDHITLRIFPEIVHRLDSVSWFELEDAWGKITTTFPIYETWRGYQTLSLRSGTPSLMFVISPKRQVLPPHEDTRVLVFVRADIPTPEP